MTKKSNARPRGQASKPSLPQRQTQPKGNYEIGHGRPPTEPRWKKGQSGNPSGRPRRKKYDFVSFTDALAQQFREPLTVMEDGKKMTISAAAYLAKVIFRDAVAKDGYSRRFLLNHLSQHITGNIFEHDPREEQHKQFREMLHLLVNPNTTKADIDDLERRMGDFNEDNADWVAEQERYNKKPEQPDAKSKKKPDDDMEPA